MENLKNLLTRCQNGNAILFCGAGLTADCLNFSNDEVIGIGNHLLEILNTEMESQGKQNGYRNIKNAAKNFKKELGTHYLMNFLQKNFALSDISASVEDLLKYPWASIYTTNYDNGIELALHKNGQKYTSLNNLDNPDEATSKMRVVHLHGSAEAWTDATFEKSCILDTDSYFDLPIKPWLDRLRYDIERAGIVIFIGFSASDFHLNQVFFNAAGLKEKAFFINKPTSCIDLDESSTQEDFGLPLYIGREDFSQIVIDAISGQSPPEPRLASFAKYETIQPSKDVPPVKDIEDLFIWGKVNSSHLKRDQTLLKSDYHMIRNESKKIQNLLAKSGSIVLLHGEICEGKTIVILDSIGSFFGSRPIFQIRHAYADLIDETASILAAYSNPIFVIENSFALNEKHLLGVAKLIQSSKGNLILSARTISTEGDSSKLRALREIQSISEIRLGSLDENEVESLVILLDQIAGWRSFRKLSRRDQYQFIAKECRGKIPSVLLRLLESSYVKDKYREEYNKLSYINEIEKKAIIGVLLISNIGIDPPLSFIDQIFHLDILSILKKISAQGNTFKLVEVEKNVLRTVPSIGARNILHSVIDQKDVVDTTIFILNELADYRRRSDYDTHIFTQLMRYSILNSLVTEEDQIDRFFDNISKIAFFRRMPLFWLQWHIAMTAQKKWVKAEEYLEMGYRAAEDYETFQNKKFNKKQLHDRRAKFLIERAEHNARSGSDLFRDINDALDIVGNLLSEAEISHHPYNTLKMTLDLFLVKKNDIINFQKEKLIKRLIPICERAQKKVAVVIEGSQRSIAQEKSNEIQSIINMLRQNT